MHNTRRVNSIRLRNTSLLAAAMLTPASLAQTTEAQPETDDHTLRVPKTTVSFTMTLVEATDPEGRDLWVLTTEVPWELYDIYLYRLDQPPEMRDEPLPADAIARPSKPYVPPDRGFGHDGYPAIGMTRAAAEQFCAWLSESIDHPVRLPTKAEWTSIAGATPKNLDAHAWTAENADRTTHPVASKLANDHGLYDMFGNAAEWVITETRKPIAMGGGYLDPSADCTPTSEQQQQRAWNASDPQIPKSQWWLADCTWVGFRFVTDFDPSHALNHESLEQPTTPPGETR